MSGIFTAKRDGCPLCGEPKAKAKTVCRLSNSADQPTLVTCPTCDLVYKDQIPSEEGFEILYGPHYGHFDIQHFAVDVSAAQTRVARMGRVPGTHLDYGCGNGAFVQAALNQGFDSYGLDPFLPVPSALANDVLRSRCFNGTVRCALAAGFCREGQFDIMSMWATTEHLVTVGSDLADLIRLLRPSGGRFILNSPAGDSLSCRLRGDRWSMALIPEHLQFLSRNSLNYIAAEYGLKLVSFRRCGVPFPLGIAKGDRGEKLGDNPVDERHPRNTSGQLKSNHSDNDRSTFKALYKYLVIQDALSLKAKVSKLIGMLGIGDHIEVVFERR